jgi:molybdate transport system ATP-binding protein
VDFDLRHGERWLLQGLNGAGKTVLLKMLRGDLWPTPGSNETRTWHFARGESDTAPLRAFERIAYFGPERQDRYERHESLLDVAQVVLTGYDDSDFPLLPPTAAQRRRIVRLLEAVGLAGLHERPFRSLSYGQRRRVLLARALVRAPDVLLLDEALNGLDGRGRASFLRALQRAVPARTAWVLSTHRVADAPAGITHVARIEGGCIVSAGPVERGSLLRGSALRGSRTHRQAAARSQKRREPVPGGSGRGIPAADGFANEHPARRPRALRGAQWRVVGPEAGVRLAEHERRASKSGANEHGFAPLLRLERASVHREGGPAVIASFTWELRQGEHWRLRGRNGSGKSTLIALLHGDLWPADGGRLWREPRHAEDWKRQTGLLSPELHARYAATDCTVDEIVASGLHSSIGLDVPPTPAQRRRVLRAMQAWDLQNLRQRRARELSYGQLRRALAARMFLLPRRLLLLDEPYDGLDAVNRTRLAACVTAAVRRGATAVIATHHDDEVPDWVCNELVLGRGKVPRQRAAQGAGRQSRGSAAS